MSPRSALPDRHARPTTRNVGRGAVLAGVGVAIFGWCIADTRTQFMVQATVLPVAQVTRLSMPAALDVSPSDAARGYVDVTQPTRLSIRSNAAGFVLDVHTVLPVLSGMSVYGMSGSVTLAGEGGSIVERTRAPGSSNLDLTFHLVLNPGTEAGRYAWPLQLAVRPLTDR